MRFRRRLSLLVLAGVAAVLESRATPATAGGVTPSTAETEIENALPLTCVQAWTVSGRRYPQMLAIVTRLAKVSLANRKLTFPNSREAGLDAGRGIADDCKADPDALLFAVVDKHVRRVAKARP